MLALGLWWYGCCIYKFKFMDKATGWKDNCVIQAAELYT